MIPPIAAQLKEATAGLHTDVENKLSAILFLDNLDPLTYQQLLEKMFTVYTTLENAVRQLPDLCALITDRSKIHWISKDLDFLESLTGKRRAFSQEEFLHKINVPRAWGILYVMEGATLGGAVISRQLGKHSWVSPACLRFFSSYGEDRGPRWKEFLEALHHYSRQNTEKQQDILVGAHVAFKCMEKSLNELNSDFQWR